MMVLSLKSLLLTLAVVVMVGVALCGGATSKNGEQARQERKRQDPRNITHCDSGASDMGSFDWRSYRGRWYVSRITVPLGPTVRDLTGYAVDIDPSSIEPNAKDKAWREMTVDRKDTLVTGDSRKCRERSWQCRREQGSSQTVCYLSAGELGTMVQKSVVMATDYTSTAAVYRENYVNNRFLSRQISLLVRSPGADPDLGVIEQALHDYCGIYAADPNSEFYKTISNSVDLSCFYPEGHRL
ncbi:uncharacterized protein LOC143291650 [Babylonia areolata]|uniref:uncharacterized protein LOC143291650 n=1 Tax=Babylonia areolata TaxID=304850 RepID=UPI003FD68BFD